MSVDESSMSLYYLYYDETTFCPDEVPRCRLWCRYRCSFLQVRRALQDEAVLRACLPTCRSAVP